MVSDEGRVTGRVNVEMSSEKYGLLMIESKATEKETSCLATLIKNVYGKTPALLHQLD